MDESLEKETGLSILRSGDVLAQVGRPGLWKLGAPTRDGLPLQVFEVPLVGPLGQRRATDVEQVVSWARTCLAAGRSKISPPAPGDRLPSEWSPPSREELEALVPAARRTLGVGPFSTRGVLVRAPHRLALRFDLFGAARPDLSTLSAPRRAWLEAVLAQACTWRLVRVGRLPPGGDASPLVAEVDLTGAPHALIETLLPFALDALCCVCSWLLLSVRFLCDPDRACTIWEVPPEQHPAAERSRSHA